MAMVSLSKHGSTRRRILLFSFDLLDFTSCSWKAKIQNSRQQIAKKICSIAELSARTAIYYCYPMAMKTETLLCFYAIHKFPWSQFRLFNFIKTAQISYQTFITFVLQLIRNCKLSFLQKIWLLSKEFSFIKA